MPASTHTYTPATVYGHPVPQILAAAIALAFIALVVAGVARLVRNARP